MKGDKRAVRTKKQLLKAIHDFIGEAPGRQTPWQESAVALLGEAAEMLRSQLTVSEAGQKGGATVKEQRGTKFYQEIGKKGGRATMERHGSAHYRTLGAKGGTTLRENVGSEHYRKIGTQGGAKVRELIAAGKAAIESGSKTNE